MRAVSKMKPKVIKLRVERNVDGFYSLTYLGIWNDTLLKDNMCEAGFERATGIHIRSNSSKVFTLTPRPLRRKVSR